MGEGGQQAGSPASSNHPPVEGLGDAKLWMRKANRRGPKRDTANQSLKTQSGKSTNRDASQYCKQRNN